MGLDNESGRSVLARPPAVQMRLCPSAFSEPEKGEADRFLTSSLSVESSGSQSH